MGADIAVANGQGSGLQFLAVADGKPLGAAALGDDTDNVRYYAAARIVYAGYGDGAIAAISPDDGKVLGQARLAGHPGVFSARAVRLPHIRQRTERVPNRRH